MQRVLYAKVLDYNFQSFFSHPAVSGRIFTIFHNDRENFNALRYVNIQPKLNNSQNKSNLFCCSH